MTQVKCKVCGGESRHFDSAEIRGKHTISYFRCEECGLIETEPPYWLDEAYSTAIADADIGLVARNIFFARQTAVIIRVLFRGAVRFVDYGGGYGLFVRLMRDAGFDFWLFDKYCPNLFAKGFEARPEHRPFDLLTAFEVFEHLVNPAEELDRMLELSRNILFSTVLVSKRNPPAPGAWWYYSLQSGQHVTIYTIESLSKLAASRKLRLYSEGDLHLFTESAIPGWLFRLLLKFKGAQIASAILPRKPSLSGPDYTRITGEPCP